MGAGRRFPDEFFNGIPVAGTVRSACLNTKTERRFHAGVKRKRNPAGAMRMRVGEIEARSRAPFFPKRVSIAHNSIGFIVSRAGRDNSRRRECRDRRMAKERNLAIIVDAEPAASYATARLSLSLPLLAWKSAAARPDPSSHPATPALR